MIADAIERGLASANYHADLAGKRRSLSAWGTVERKGSGWSWHWSGFGLAMPELLPEPSSNFMATTEQIKELPPSEWGKITKDAQQ